MIRNWNDVSDTRTYELVLKKIVFESGSESRFESGLFAHMKLNIIECSYFDEITKGASRDPFQGTRLQ